MFSPPPPIVLPPLMVLSIITSRPFNYFPMSAFVGADTAKALRVLSPGVKRAISLTSTMFYLHRYPASHFMKP